MTFITHKYEDEYVHNITCTKDNKLAIDIWISITKDFDYVLKTLQFDNAEKGGIDVVTFVYYWCLNHDMHGCYSSRNIT